MQKEHIDQIEVKDAELLKAQTDNIKWLHYKQILSSGALAFITGPKVINDSEKSTCGKKFSKEEIAAITKIIAHLASEKILSTHFVVIKRYQCDFVKLETTLNFAKSAQRITASMLDRLIRLSPEALETLHDDNLHVNYHRITGKMFDDFLIDLERKWGIYDSGAFKCRGPKFNGFFTII